ncbi:hypothetical protein [Caulobacter endophyticus]|nr:hypothetical protein [Caulobacter endophyticus]MDG2528968.1 hypothetical protein [Caulobacter endophyticus]
MVKLVHRFASAAIRTAIGTPIIGFSLTMTEGGALAVGEAKASPPS